MWANAAIPAEKNHQNGAFSLLIPLSMLGGAVLRLYERIAASPIIPKRWRGSYVQYLWTDGHTVWHSAYDVPADAHDVVQHAVWPDVAVTKSAGHLLIDERTRRDKTVATQRVASHE